MKEPNTVSVILRFPEPTREERAKANAYFAALAKAQEQFRGDKSALQSEFDRIWREANGMGIHAKPVPSGAWNSPNPAPKAVPAWGNPAPKLSPDAWGKK
jgi:hypothetical protein